MSLNLFFINDTKKQVVDTKQLFGDFEDKQQLLCYLNMCAGDNIRIRYENDTWVENWLIDNKHDDYNQIKLSSFEISVNDDLYESSEYDRLHEAVTKSTGNGF